MNVTVKMNDNGTASLSIEGGAVGVLALARIALDWAAKNAEDDVVAAATDWEEDARQLAAETAAAKASDPAGRTGIDAYAKDDEPAEVVNVSQLSELEAQAHARDARIKRTAETILADRNKSEPGIGKVYKALAVSSRPLAVRELVTETGLDRDTVKARLATLRSFGYVTVKGERNAARWSAV